MANIVAKPDLFKSEVYTAEVMEGTLLGEYLPSNREDLKVVVNGNLLETDQVGVYKIRRNDIITVTLVPGRDSARSLAIVLVATIAAAYLGPAALEAIGITSTSASYETALAVSKGIFSVLGIALGQRLFGAPIPKTHNPGSVTGKPAITGTSNRANLYGPIPKLYGTYRYYPPLAAAWNTEIAGNDQYMRMLVCLGYGPLSIGGTVPSPGHKVTQNDVMPFGTIKIGDNDISLYDNYEFEIGYFPDITLYTQDIQESVPGIDLNGTPDPPEGQWVSDSVSSTQTSGFDARELSVDITFPQGLWCVNSTGQTKSATVRFAVEYRSTGTSDPWIPVATNENSIQLFDTVVSPGSDDGAAAGPTVTLTPPLGMINGNYVTVFVTYRDTTGTITVSNTGGQSWTSETQVNTGNIRLRMFHCRFNGTWAANPAFTVTSGSNAISGIMNVWTGVNTVTALDTTIQSGSIPPTSSVLIPSIVTNSANALVLTTAASDDDNVWSISPGWSNTGQTQYRNSTGSDSSITQAYRSLKTPGDSNQVILTKTTQDVSATGSYYTIVLRPTTIWSIAGPIKETIRKSFRWVVPKGQYDVRITRVESYYTDSEAVYADAIWTALRTIKYDDDPNTNDIWNENDNTIMMALRIKATDQLNGVVDQLSVLASSLLEVWVGDHFETHLTNNPAWCAYDVLTGVQIQRTVAASRIDKDAFLEWANWCDANGITYNWVHDQDETILQRFRTIATTGNAALSIQDGKYTIVRDTVQTVPVQVISPRNSKSFNSTRAFKDLPHALRVQYVNDTHYETDEVIAYRDLYGPNPGPNKATSFEELQTTGITNSDQAWKFGQYFIRAAQLRPEIYKVDMDFENLVATRGDLVRLAHDVIEVGLQWGRITAFDNTAHTITLDEAIVMDGTSNYAIRVRTQDGTQVVIPVNNVAGINNTLTATGSITTSGISVGDLVLFGVVNEEAIDAKITDIQYNQDFSATLTLVDNAPGIYDFGISPVYDPHITKPVDLTKLVPPLPVITNVVSNESVMFRGGDGNLRTAMVVSFILTSNSNIPVDKVEMRYRPQGSSNWLYTSVTDGRGTMRVTDVEETVIYELQLRSHSPYGPFSDWTDLTTHQVIGKTSKPTDVTVFAATIRDFSIYLKWDRVPDIDVVSYEIRQGTVWESATFLARVDADYYLSGVATAGSLTYMIKAVDVGGLYSNNAASASLVVSAPSRVSVTAEVIDNNVLLRWSVATGSLAIMYYEIKRGAVYGSADFIGNKDGLFTVVFESVAGDYTYWVTAVDQAGNKGPPSGIRATVNQPPDYVLNINWLDDWTGPTTTNLADNATGLSLASIGATTQVIGPVNLSETYQQHFTNNSWTSPQDQIDAGFVYFAEPSQTSAQYIQTFDYGGVLSSSIISISQSVFLVDGSVSYQYTISTSLDNSTWTDYTNTSRVQALNFRYVKITMDIAYSASVHNDLLLMDPIRVRLDSKIKTDSGSGTVSTASTGKVVNFNLTFVDIISIVVTPNVSGPSSGVIPVVDFVDAANPTSFTVYLFNAAGTKITGDFSWTARGY